MIQGLNQGLNTGYSFWCLVVFLRPSRLLQGKYLKFISAMSPLNSIPLYTINEHFYGYKSFFFFVLLHVLVNHLTTIRKTHKSMYREILSSYGLCSINLQVYHKIYAIICNPVANYILCGITCLSFLFFGATVHYLFPGIIVFVWKMKIITAVALLTFVFTCIVITAEVCCDFGVLHISLDSMLVTYHM